MMLNNAPFNEFVKKTVKDGQLLYQFLDNLIDST